MKHLIAILTLLATFSLLAQDDDVFSGNYEDTPIIEVIEDIQSQVSARIYFKKEWLEGVIVSGSFDNSSVNETLESLFADTDLNFYQNDEGYILLKGERIIDPPAIASYFRDGNAVTSVEKGLIFSREYLTDETNELEEMVFEIGNRGDLVAGGSSTLAGYVNDANEKPVEGALVYVQEPFTSTITDERGFYSLTLPNGKNQLMVQFVGMKPTLRNVVLFSSGRLDIDLEEDVIALDEVTVSAEADRNVTNVQMGVERINVEAVKNVPILLGEKDILKIASTLPGVQQVGEGASGFNVRGGKSDQNLFLVNNATVYNTSHFFGFFSVFNSDAIQNMELFKSSIPAKYGGRLSSVFDIQIKEANNQKFSGKGSVGPVTSALTLEVPIIKEKTSWLVSGRTTYSNWLLKRVGNDAFKQNRVSFYDFVTQLDHKFSDNSRITISAYSSEDEFRLTSDSLFSFSDFSFRNLNGSIKWNQRFGQNLEKSTYLTYSNYDYELLYDQSEPNAFTQDFGINDISFGSDFRYFLGQSHTFSFGLQSRLYRLNPGTKEPFGPNSLVGAIEVDEERALESAIYFADDYEFSEQLSLSAGVRFVMFNSLGPGTVYEYQPDQPRNTDTEIGSETFRDGDIIQTYSGPEFRLSSRYALDQRSSVKLSFNRTRQYLHTLTNSASLSPTDIWRLSSKYIKPQASNQVSLGYYRNFLGNQLETSLEGYYKNLENLLDFKIGADFLLNPTVEQAVLQGDGRSYGMELSIKKSGDFNGWLSYTYSRAFIQLDSDFIEERVNNGNFYPTSFDKPHNLNLVTNYKLTRRFSLSANVVYSTGRPVTFPVGIYDLKGFENVHFSERNAFRIPDYFRLDLGFNMEGNHKIKKLAHSFWSFSVYNVTGRDNPFSVFFDLRDGAVSGYQLVVFNNPIPTISYNFKF